MQRRRVTSFDAEALRRARETFPEVRADAEAFAAHVASREGTKAVHLAELWVAWAAGRGDAAAIKRVDAWITTEARLAAARVDRSAAFVDEVRQALRIRLLVADGHARIADYMGRGPLRGWLGIAALRIALNLKRASRPASADLLGELVEGEADPELQHLKTLYRAEFREALAQAIAALPDRDRALLRLSYVDGLTMTKLGGLYAVHGTTVARWVERAAAAVATDTRRRLMAKLALSASGVDSIGRMVLSNLELSISRVLRD